MSAVFHSAALEPSRPGLSGRFIAACRRALPPLAMTVAGTACWTVVIGAGAVLGVIWLGWQTPEKIGEIGVLYGLGAAIAFPLALFVARLVSHGRSAEAAFAAMFLALALSTLGVTALLFALKYRSYYSEWHNDFGTITWAFQFFFTCATALVQFSVLGARLLFPVGFVALFVAALWFARRAR